MAQDIVIAGAAFNAVPSVEIPTAQGGTAKFVDPSPTTAAAADVAQGKLFFDALGALIAGTASGGGGGLEYESGTWSPASDTSRGEISFSKSHTEAPIIIFMVDTADSYNSTSNTNQIFGYVDLEKVFGVPLHRSASTKEYVAIPYVYRASAANTFSATVLRLTISSSSSVDSNDSYPRYYATNAKFMPYTYSSTRYWRAGRTYKWIAVWKP